MPRFTLGENGSLHAEEMTWRDWLMRGRAYLSEMYHDVRLRFMMMASRHSKTLVMQSYWSMDMKWRVTIFRNGYKTMSIEVVDDD